MSFSPALIALVNDQTPEVLLNLKLQKFITHPAKNVSSPVIALVANVVRTCPKLSNWRTFVTTSPAVEALLTRELANVVPAKELPSFELLGSLLHESIQNKFGSTRVRKGTLKQKLSDLFPEDFRPSTMPVTPVDPVGEVADLAQEVLSVSDHVHQIQEEMLRNDEREVRASIAATYTLYKKAKDRTMQDRQFELLRHSQRALVELHLEKRKFKEKRLKERIRYVEQLSAKGPAEAGGLNPELLAAYRKNVDLQKEAITLLEKLYDALVGAIQFANVAAELSSLERQISILYDVSFSVVVAGLISVGKSTFVNCITGQNLCPNRVETMTAIPTNYVHDPTAAEPVMMVPFADQLNHLLNVTRQLIVHYGKEEIINAAGGKPHLKNLLDVIDAGLVFQPRYVGAETILEHSTYIHDIFRLAVEDALSEALAPLLPMDWSQGLDTYLTVFVRFPRAEVATGLVNFSIVDTPGVNEFGVRKLELRRTIRDTLSVSSFGALISTKVCPNSTDMSYLKTLFQNVKNKYNLPMSVILTHCEELTTKQALHSVQENVALGLSPDLSHPTFEIKDVFPIAGRRMTVATRTLLFIEQHKRRPELDSPDRSEAVLADDFLSTCLGGGLREDWLETYAESSKDDVIKSCQRAIKASSVPATIDHLMNLAVKDGIRVLVQNAFKRTHEVISTFVARYQALDDKKLKKAEERVQEDIKVLQERKLELTNSVNEYTASAQERIRNQAGVAKRDLEVVLSGNLQKEDVFLLSSLTDHLQNQVRKITDEKTKALVYQKEPVTFPSEQAFKHSQSELPLKFKIAVQMYFWLLNKDVPSQAHKFTSRKRAEIEDSLRRIGERYTEAFNLKADQASTTNFRELDSEYEQDQESLDFGFRTVRKGALGVLSFLIPKTKTFEVLPIEARDKLKEYTEKVIEEKGDATRKAVEKRVKESTTEFLVAISNEIKRLTDGALAVQKALTMTTEQVTAPVRRVTDNLKSVLDQIEAKKKLVEASS